MMVRWIKIALVACIGLQALFYVLHNLANLGAAHGALSYVLSGADHVVYPDTAFFHVGNSTLAWLPLAMVFAGEFLVGIFGLKGAVRMFRARNAEAEVFHEAKRDGVIAAGLALLVWFGLFMTFGAAFFQMWQTEVGAGSMEGAFMYAVVSAVAMLFVCLTED
ncbi:DUF2165 family protein [Sphingomicrobium clamense]|uniref:DUF2165 domain-containing protein n=1 Tax=Sphingomicrobium clamense TaxID=2851013 RepID=A0ABS6V652_9SPHN|nr:DUF2165 family protein [Sphingomicrobium sp. B8]MBW0145039.1 DUF2165 domain-containing protein [Sphingomicrobium sp. B8]